MYTVCTVHVFRTRYEHVHLSYLPKADLYLFIKYTLCIKNSYDQQYYQAGNWTTKKNKEGEKQYLEKKIFVRHAFCFKYLLIAIATCRQMCILTQPVKVFGKWRQLLKKSPLNI